MFVIALLEHLDNNNGLSTVIHIMYINMYVFSN